jgi:hypothetical protein
MNRWGTAEMPEAGYQKSFSSDHRPGKEEQKCNYKICKQVYDKIPG